MKTVKLQNAQQSTVQVGNVLFFGTQFQAKNLKTNKSQKIVAKGQEHTGFVCVSYYSEGKLFTGASDKKIKIWG